jgi:hemoglobin
MKRAHSGMDITKSDFNALVEVLQLTMDAQDIPFRVQNQLLALLAPMHRDIVNTP